MLKQAGISLSVAKKPLVAGRLAKRLSHYQISSYRDYYRILAHDRQEFQRAIDLLTTNETRFFREPLHFRLLQEQILPAYKNNPARRAPLRIWSAASSSGEEAYSLAIVCAACLGEQPWEIFASDISLRVLQKARTGLYDMNCAAEIPQAYLHAWCLKGTGAYRGQFLIDARLQARVSFAQVNLNAELPAVGMFDLIFLRNVMIYFDKSTKQAVVARLSQKLKDNGWLFIGQAETLNGLQHSLVMHTPSVYRKIAT